MMKWHKMNVYVVTGSEDGPPLGVFSSYKKALVRAVEYAESDIVEKHELITFVGDNNNTFSTIKKEEVL